MRPSPPTTDELKSFGCIHPGWLLKGMQPIYGVTKQMLYNRDIYVRLGVTRTASP